MKYTVCLEEKYKSKILNTAAAFDTIVIDAQDYTAAEIRQLKAGGARILSYLNVGAVESDRSYFSAAKKAGLLLGEYDNWPDNTGWQLRRCSGGRSSSGWQRPSRRKA